MACDSLSTSLLQVDCPNLSSTGLLQVVLTSCNTSANNKLQHAGWIFTDLLQLDENDKLVSTC